MGVKNYLIDGVSCAGKTTVCNELQRRGYQVIHGDDELAYWGDLKTGEPVNGVRTHLVSGYGTLRRSTLWRPIKIMR
jgi:adenylate kinase family enzyme